MCVRCLGRRTRELLHKSWTMNIYILPHTKPHHTALHYITPNHITPHCTRSHYTAHQYTTLHTLTRPCAVHFLWHNSDLHTHITHIHTLNRMRANSTQYNCLFFCIHGVRRCCLCECMRERVRVCVCEGECEREFTCVFVYMWMHKCDCVCDCE
jgi:hypothetical protein